METRKTIREELTGKTELSPEYENDLFIRLEQIEKDGNVIESLGKSDWILMGIAFFGFGIFPLLYFAFKLF